MKLFSRENQLDEMQEKTLRKIESTGFWLAWGGLLVTFLIQTVLRKPFETWAAEWLLFMVLSAYVVFFCIKNGIWDRHLKANKATNLVCSLIAGVVVAVYTFVLNEGYWPGALMTGLCTALLSFAALQLSVALYKKRHNELEKENREDEDV